MHVNKPQAGSSHVFVRPLLRLAGALLHCSRRSASAIACTWRGQEAVLKIVQPLVVKDDGEVVELQLLLANEARLYSGRLKALQGA